jgi:hypothetical protein
MNEGEAVDAARRMGEEKRGTTISLPDLRPHGRKLRSERLAGGLMWDGV